mmetsp:Transcript_18380/g.25896  ORF Transcript_18380/g.25896 Transcript_18380/m.25896 type:complete len:347 (+) Transcript_18380:70-1110(+)
MTAKTSRSVLMTIISIIVFSISWIYQSAKGFHLNSSRFPFQKDLRTSCHRNMVKASTTKLEESRGSFLSKKSSSKSGKKIVLIRHGCTYMNEYLSKAGCGWGDAGFTDIFPEEDKVALYRDTPLSPTGQAQAKLLSQQLKFRHSHILEEIEIIAVSPLTRALQTVELALLPNVKPLQKINGEKMALDKDLNTKMFFGNSKRNNKEVPVVALPLAAERMYLVSDIGSKTSKLAGNFPYVDFDSEFETSESEWWFKLKHAEKYREWRPNGRGQTYAYPGEPQDAFDSRMSSLYDWLAKREESCICLVCHWGVLEWLTGDDFDNCEMRVLDFNELRCNIATKQDLITED